MRSAQRNLVEPARLLLERGADLAIRDNDGNTALDLATINSHHVVTGIIRREQDRRAMVQMDDADGADSEDAAGAPSMG